MSFHLKVDYKLCPKVEEGVDERANRKATAMAQDVADAMIAELVKRCPTLLVRAAWGVEVHADTLNGEIWAGISGIQYAFYYDYKKKVGKRGPLPTPEQARLWVRATLTELYDAGVRVEKPT